MQEKVNRITSLIEKYLEEQLSLEEEKELNEWLEESETNRLFFEQLTDKEILREKLKTYASADSEAMWRKTLQKIDGGKLVTMYPEKTSIRKYIAAAAAAIVIVSAGMWLYFGQTTPKEEITKTDNTSPQLPRAILPGGNKAILTLADNSTIVLNTARNGSIATQGKTQITKTDGRLIYNKEPDADKNQNSPIAYNTVTTPRGGEYQIALPDGSKVWLNAASSLRFPIAFAGNERIVELTGEAYFEVNPQNRLSASAQKPAKTPFIVKIVSQAGNSSEVEVLGTHFNVMSYTDEAAVKTTLLEGAVKVRTGANSKMLAPGQQARLNKGAITVQKVNTNEAVAWKNGFLPVSGADIESTMRQIARWYDIGIEFRGKKPEVSLQGKIPRKESIQNVIKVLNENNIHVRLLEKERKLIVTP